MDTWNEKQLRLMTVGGNANCRDFFEKYGIYDIMDLRKRYETDVAQLYKEKLKILAEGGEWEDPPYEEVKEKLGELLAQKKRSKGRRVRGRGRRGRAGRRGRGTQRKNNSPNQTRRLELTATYTDDDSANDLEDFLNGRPTKKERSYNRDDTGYIPSHSRMPPQRSRSTQYNSGRTGSYGSVTSDGSNYFFE